MFAVAIREHARKIRPQGSRNAREQRQRNTHLHQRQVMRNDEKLRDEKDSRVAAERTHRGTDRHPAEGPLAPKSPENCREARGRYVVFQIVDGAAYRLANTGKQVEREQEPRCTGGKECVTPAVMFGNPAAAKISDKQSNIESGGIKRQGRAAIPRWIQIRQ